jgi:hypothetical protein
VFYLSLTDDKNVDGFDGTQEGVQKAEVGSCRRERSGRPLEL